QPASAGRPEEDCGHRAAASRNHRGRGVGLSRTTRALPGANVSLLATGVARRPAGADGSRVRPEHTVRTTYRVRALGLDQPGGGTLPCGFEPCAVRARLGYGAVLRPEVGAPFAAGVPRVAFRRRHALRGGRLREPERAP